MFGMRRRDFVTLLGGAAAAWSFAARGKPTSKVYRIGRFTAGWPIPHLRDAFVDAFQALGWVEGKNVIYEERFAENQLDRLPDLAAELVRLKVDVITAAGTLAPLA